MTSVVLVSLAALALAAFTTEGAIGFGGTVLAASIGAQLVPLVVLLPAFVPVNMVLSSYLLLRGVRVIAWRMLAAEIAPPVAVGAAVGLALFHLPGQRWFALVFGAFVVMLAGFELARPGSDRPLGRVQRLVLLGLGGVAHGLFGTGGPMIVYVVRRRLADKRAFRATLAVLWLVLNVALLANFAGSGLYGPPVLDVGILVAATIVPGLVVGERIHRRLDAARFERVVWIVLFAAGAALALRSAWALAR